MALFTSLSAFANSNEIDVAQAQATPLIQQDRETQSLDALKIAQTQARVVQDMSNLAQLSIADIAGRITDIGSQVIEHWIAGYPVRSTLLSPGNVESISVHVVLTHPLFIIGDDARSKAWLVHYQKRLIMVRAQGLVVNIESHDAMTALQQQFTELPLIAISGDAIAQWLHLKHYPVLISNNMIEQ
ncbi:MAG: integrating conjugative element protein [Gammaproteobacteria bacterium]|nr:integrating conjugative element protein [Gammaproteobacteria bacterium]